MPLIGVSLIENAFKHGISPTEPSFIHIRIAGEASRVIYDIENSNHPKTENDHSGHGIGLQQVQHRLDLSYPNRYEWTHGVSDDGKVYKSTIKLNI
jgi:sensor histidine kinase YesM